MSKHNDVVAIHKDRSTLVRPKFGPGMLLQHEDLDQMTAYTQELSRLMFRSLFGCGVITKCGKVYVTVGTGLALDCSGDPVYVPKDQPIVFDDQCDPNLTGTLWVVLCGTVTCCAPRTSLCASDEDEAPAVCTRERDGFEIRVVRQRPKCVCGCKDPEERDNSIDLLIDTECKCVNPNLECYKDHYDGKCGCSCDDCSDCGCKCVLLARLDNSGNNEHPNWSADHSVRRFIRPVLMRDPQVESEEIARQQAQATSTYAARAETKVAGSPSHAKKMAGKSPVHTKTSTTA
jgi:hypothetical protein